MRFWPLFIAALISMPSSALGDIFLAARTLRSQTILTADDLILQKSDAPGGDLDISDFVGREARVVLYQGRPISLSDLGPAAIIERNQSVTLKYLSGALLISAEGRALGRAGVGESLRVMNQASRNTVFGIVDKSGSVIVGGGNAGISN